MEYTNIHLISDEEIRFKHMSNNGTQQTIPFTLLMSRRFNRAITCYVLLCSMQLAFFFFYFNRFQYPLPMYEKMFVSQSRIIQDRMEIAEFRSVKIENCRDMTTATQNPTKAHKTQPILFARFI